MVNASAYTVTSITSDGNPFDVVLMATSTMFSAIVSDFPSLSAYSYDASFVTADRKPFNVQSIVYSGIVTGLIKESPSIAATGLLMPVVTAETYPFDVTDIAKSSIVTAIISPPPFKSSSVRYSAIIEDYPQGVPTYGHQIFSQSIMHDEFIPAELVFSTLNTAYVTSHAAIASDHMPMPKSYEHISSMAQLYAVDTLAVMPSSMEQFGSVALLEIRSMVERHNPVSMNYEHEMLEKVLLQSNAIPMWQSNALSKSMAMKALVRSNVEWPKGEARLVETVEMALVPMYMPMYVGREWVYESVEMALIDAQGDNPIGDEDYAQSFEMALIDTDMGKPSSPSDVGEYVEHALVESKETPPVLITSNTSTSSYVEKALINSTYPSVTGMAGANMPALIERILIGSDIDMPTGYVIAKQEGLEWLIGSEYPDPNTMIPLEEAAILPSFTHKTVVERHTDFAWSWTTMLDIAQATMMGTEERTPEEILSSGLFVDVVAETMAHKAEYDSARNSHSDLTISQAVEVMATIDNTFPDKSYSTSDLSIGLIAQAIVGADSSFPSKDTPRSKLVASGVYEVVSFNDESFPPKWMPQSSLESSFIAEIAINRANDYPSKDVVQSHLQADLISMVSATGAVYPDKDTPASYLVTDMVGQVAAYTDKTMYSMPDKPIRRRPNISITIVY